MRILPLNKTHQQGAALVVALIILLVVTVMGLTGINNSSNELKLAAATQNRAKAFEAAEAVLKSVEQNKITTPPDTKKFVCADAGACTYSACRSGECFKGLYSGADPMACDVLNANDTSYSDYWQNETLWGGSGGYSTQNHTHGSHTEPVKYLVEFICFGRKSTTIETATPGNREKNEADMATLLRISVRSEGPTGNSPVTLQSVVKVNLRN